MSTLLPRDANNSPIPALRLLNNGAHVISATSSASVKNTNGFNMQTQIISIYATAPITIAFGESDVVATSSDHYFPAGVYYDLAIGGEGVDHTPYMAVLAVDADTEVYISEKN